MKANQLKPSSKLAHIVLGDLPPVVTKEGHSVNRYVNGERTNEVIGYATDLVLLGQHYEKVRCDTPTMPKIFMSGEITGELQVELVNPIAEITYKNEIKLTADDIILYDDGVIL